jgi:hypothetical protein
MCFFSFLVLLSIEMSERKEALGSSVDYFVVGVAATLSHSPSHSLSLNINQDQSGPVTDHLLALALGHAQPLTVDLTFCLSGMSMPFF